MIRFACDSVSVFDKTNLASLCAFNGDSAGVQLCLENNIPYLMNHEGKTPFDYCQSSSDFHSMNAIY
eukprot:UN05595